MRATLALNGLNKTRKWENSKFKYFEIIKPVVCGKVIILISLKFLMNKSVVCGKGRWREKKVKFTTNYLML